MNKPLETLLNKQMTRKEFLQHIGVILLTLFGIANLIRYLSLGDTTTNQKYTRGYGANTFGGTGKVKFNKFLRS